jgi:hypothetical protein
MTTSSSGVVGFGFHWGNDFTLNMEDTEKEWLGFEALSIDTAVINLGNLDLPDELKQGISGKYLPIYLSRTDWERTNFNIGGKIYIDVIPVIDALELSCNFGLWQYKGSISYPKSIALRNFPYIDLIKSPEDLFDVTYETIPLTLKEYDMDYFGLDGTPYAKLGFDLTVRKYLFKLPPITHTLRVHGGGGLSLNFATPILHQTIIEKALSKQLEGKFTLDALDSQLFSKDELMEDVLNLILDELMTPHLGCHIDLGVMVKLPLIPLGIYVDGKYMIPFDNMDEHIDLGGFGLVVNAGVSLTF